MLIKIKTHKHKFLFIAAIFLVAAAFFIPYQFVNADRYQEKINKLNADIEKDQSVLLDLRKERNTLENKLQQLQIEQRQAQAAIDKTELEITKTQKEIKDTEKELAHKKRIMQENAKTLYKNGRPSTLEILFASANFSEFINRQEYLERVKTAIYEAAKEIIVLQEQLVLKEEELTITLRSQEALRNKLALKKEEQAQLLEETQGEESRYQSIVANKKAELERLKAEQAAEIAARQSGGDLRFGNTNYPYIHSDCFDDDGRFNGMDEPSPCDSHIDPWYFYYQQCTSYVAWRRFNLNREIPKWGQIVPTNGKHFKQRAEESGYLVNGVPAKGAIAVYTGGKWGHVMIVEKVNADGTINISQFNAQLDGRYSEVHNLPSSQWSSYWFIHNKI